MYDSELDIVELFLARQGSGESQAGDQCAAFHFLDCIYFGEGPVSRDLTLEVLDWTHSLVGQRPRHVCG